MKDRCRSHSPNQHVMDGENDSLNMQVSLYKKKLYNFKVKKKIQLTK